jgi:beta-lactamase superfamily II metal-dependent hydrolase
LFTTTHEGLTWATMIDCGHKNNDRGRWFPGDYLRSRGIDTIDLLIITNLDEDHVSGLPNLLNCGINIRNIFSNPTVEPWAIRYLKAQYGMGDGIEAVVSELTRRGVAQQLSWVPDVDIRCFWNPYPAAFEDENNLSVITSLTFGGSRILFTGDMECAGFNHLSRTNAAIRTEVRAVDFLVAPHHGRANGLCPDLFSAYGCAPKLTIISDDYKQYDSQETDQWYRIRTTGYPFKSEGDTRYVLTTRNDGNIDFIPIQSAQQPSVEARNFEDALHAVPALVMRVRVR